MVMNSETTPRDFSTVPEPATLPLRRSVVVTNPQGLHMRPASAFAKRAREFAADVKVIRAEHGVNGKSQLDLLMLAAEPGAELVLEVDGADAERALTELAELLADPGTQDDDDA